MIKLNNMFNKDKKMQQLHEAAVAGDTKAQYILGLCYFYGKNGLTEDLSQGIAWLKEAGMAGYKRAQKKLIEIIPDNYINDSDIIHWLYQYDSSRYDRLCALHQMMM
jgi:TPR repeat protein